MEKYTIRPEQWVNCTQETGSPILTADVPDLCAVFTMKYDQAHNGFKVLAESCTEYDGESVYYHDALSDVPRRKPCPTVRDASWLFDPDTMEPLPFEVPMWLVKNLAFAVRVDGIYDTLADALCSEHGIAHGDKVRDALETAAARIAEHLEDTDGE